MPIAVILRRLFLITLLTVPQVYWLGYAWRFRATGRFGSACRWAVRLLVVVAAVVMMAVLYDRISVKFLPAKASYYIAPIVQLWIFSSTFAFFLTKALHGIARCWTRLRWLFRQPALAGAHDPTRRTMLHQVGSILGATPFLAAVYGYSLERLRFEVVRVEVPLANLPTTLDGLRILQLSDIHVGDFMPIHEIRRAVRMANDLAPHLAVITGDYLTSRGDPLAECIGELAGLRAPLGVWGCNGNHEIYADAEDDTEKLFQGHGMRLLRREAAQIEWNGAALNLIGIDYQRSVRFNAKSIPSLDGAERLVRRDMPNILLSHNPNTFYAAADAGVELSLAGHTHGGQVNVEIVNRALNPARFVTDFVAGLYRMPLSWQQEGVARSEACLYVNRGLGTLGVPARIGSNPEISLLTLRASPAR